MMDSRIRCLGGLIEGKDFLESVSKKFLYKSYSYSGH